MEKFEVKIIKIYAHPDYKYPKLFHFWECPYFSSEFFESLNVTGGEPLSGEALLMPYNSYNQCRGLRVSSRCFPALS